MSMINNSLTWFSITIIFTIISLLINQLFKNKNPGLQKQIDDDNKIKENSKQSILGLISHGNTYKLKNEININL